jgi:two-component system, NtrC family, response regulator AtoC
MTRILVIEDDLGIRSNILDLLEAEGFDPVGAADGSAGVVEALAKPPDLVLCDITMPLLDGYGVLKALAEHPATAAIPFVFLTAKADRCEIRYGMNLGADDYVTKPFTRQDLLETVRARLDRSRVRAARSPSEAPPEDPGREGSRPLPPPPRVVVLDPTMKALYAEARLAARGPISVLLLGETGVGKEMLALEIHRTSPRASGPFVALNCASLADSLLESELFGHEKNSFTGATHAKPGLLETAGGGTVLLDEIGDIPLATQVKLLRVIEERKVTRVGGRVAIPIDVRFVSATHRDLEGEAQRGGFRQDLLFRLNGVTLEIPPLRERKAELEVLASVFLEGAAHALGRPTPRIAPAALGALLAYEWPGNVRELRHAMERAALMCAGEEVALEHLPPRVAAVGGRGPARVASTLASSSAVAPSGAHASGDLREERRVAVEDIERRQIEDALARCGGNQTAAAALLGISRRTLVARLAQYDFPRPRKR